MPKKTTKPKKNPSDPIVLARSVVEAAIGEPLTQKDIMNDKSSIVLRAIHADLTVKGRLDEKEFKALLSVLIDMAERLERLESRSKR